MYRLSTFILLLLCSLASNADNTDTALQAGFSMESLQTGEFTQERWLTILDQPLISKGKFSIEKNASIKWHLQTPFEIVYSFDGNTLKISDNGAPKKVNRKEDPMLYGFFSFFFKIFNLSYNEMDEWFEISYRTVGEVRHIDLLPKKSFMKKSFEHALVVESEGFIQSITIFEEKGDKLHLQFSYTLP